MYKDYLRSVSLLLVPVIAVALSGCASTKHLEIEDSFPVPLMEKVPVNLGIHLDQELTEYVHSETIEKRGSWTVSVGSAQKSLFNTLAIGLFEGHSFVKQNSATPPMHGVLKPTIEEVQFSLPQQTRSDYYEVWIRYSFELFDQAGTPVGSWKLPAYGKASKKNFGSSSSGLEAAAIAACRDAMAFFSINFSREPAVAQWIQAGKPLLPPPPVTTTPESTTPASTSPAGTNPSPNQPTSTSGEPA